MPLAEAATAALLPARPLTDLAAPRHGAPRLILPPALRRAEGTAVTAAMPTAPRVLVRLPVSMAAAAAAPQKARVSPAAEEPLAK